MASYGQMRRASGRRAFTSPASWLTLFLTEYVKDRSIEMNPLELSTLTIEITDIRNDRGLTYSLISPGNVPDTIMSTYTLYLQQDRIKDGKATSEFRNLPPSSYKAFVFHDENENHIFDLAPGNSNKPLEGFRTTMSFSVPILKTKELADGISLNAETNTLTLHVDYLE